jgi:large subunit ribosomal protein L6e
VNIGVLTFGLRLNGVPLRRVSQAYVIATSTKVDITGVSIPESVNDAYFAKAKAAKSTNEGKEKKAFPEEKKSEQKVGSTPHWSLQGRDCRLTPRKSVDSALLSAISKVEHLSRYLKASWGLSKGDRFHELKF